MCFALFCEKCFAEIPEDSQLCRKCGHGFGGVSNGQLHKHPAPAIPRRTYAFLLDLLQSIEIEI